MLTLHKGPYAKSSQSRFKLWRVKYCLFDPYRRSVRTPNLIWSDGADAKIHSGIFKNSVDFCIIYLNLMSFHFPSSYVKIFVTACGRNWCWSSAPWHCDTFPRPVPKYELNISHKHMFSFCKTWVPMLIQTKCGTVRGAAWCAFLSCLKGKKDLSVGSLTHFHPLCK